MKNYNLERKLKQIELTWRSLPRRRMSELDCSAIEKEEEEEEEEEGGGEGGGGGGEEEGEGGGGEEEERKKENGENYCFSLLELLTLYSLGSKIKTNFIGMIYKYIYIYIYI